MARAYMSLREVEKHVPEMRKLGVSKVARSPRGFVTAYRRAGGRPERLSEGWRKKREGFVSRHMAQYCKHPTKRRKLALYAWAYRPRCK